MLTVETEQSPGSSAAPDQPAPGPAAPRGTNRLLGALAAIAAFLAFGVLGLLVAGWRVVRGRTPDRPACARCRQGRRLRWAGMGLLAGLVLLGSGMAVHQEANEEGLPPCSAESSAVSTGWLQARQIVTAPVSGLVRGYVHDRGGGLCEAGSMTLALLPAAASDSGVAVGSVVLTGDESSMGQEGGEAMARHESRHVTQWATLTLAAGPLAMPLLYALDDAFFPESRNHFERAAGLEDGGYPHPDGAGPRPEWVKVSVLGLLLFLAGRRRLRWASRALVGGRAGAVARQRDLCPLHTEGWFRLPRPVRP